MRGVSKSRFLHEVDAGREAEQDLTFSFKPKFFSQKKSPMEERTIVRHLNAPGITSRETGGEVKADAETWENRRTVRGQAFRKKGSDGPKETSRKTRQAPKIRVTHTKGGESCASIHIRMLVSSRRTVTVT